MYDKKEIQSKKCNLFQFSLCLISFHLGIDNPATYNMYVKRSIIITIFFWNLLW